MGKLQNFISNQKEELKGLIYNYTLTLITMAIYSVVLCVIVNAEEYLDFVDRIAAFLLIFALGNLFIETYFVDKKSGKNWKNLGLYYGINGLVSLFWTIVVFEVERVASALNNIISVDEGIIEMYIAFWFAIYVIAISIFTINKIIKKNNIDLGNYLARVIFGLLKILGLYFMLYISIALLFLLFNSLIFDFDYWDGLSNIMIILAGFLFFPYCVLVITDTQEDNSKFTKGFINYALMPCVIAAFVVVYIYVFKIIFTLNMPSNEVFYICLYVFILGGPIWLMSYGFLSKKAEETGEKIGLYGKIVKNMKYFYAPLLVLEIISMSIRIYHYGLTITRYLSIIAIIFQLIYILWDVINKAFKKDRKEEDLLFVALILVVISLVCPFINASKLSYVCQKNRFEEAMEDGDRYGELEAFYYLYLDVHGNAYLSENYTEAEKSSMVDEYFKIRYDREPNTKVYILRYISREDENSGISIKGYTDIYPFGYEKYSSNMDIKTFKEIEITYGNGDFSINVDISDYMDEIINSVDLGEDYSSEYMEYLYINQGNNACVVIESINFYYDKATGEITNVDIDGYVLINEEAHNGQ